MPQPLDSAKLRQWAGILTGPVVLPADDAYDSARIVWNRAIDRRPAGIVRCADADDVARTIEFARMHDVLLAVRSGGHSQAGLGTCSDGLVLDLSSFRSVGVDAEARTCRVAAGARVVDVMDATARLGLLTPMGGCPDVGVSGLTLGGGENFLMPTHGAVCDNLLSADVVLADGRLVTTSDAHEPDLFWAIRGGSGNFGVVTSLTYRLYAVPEVLSGELAFPVAAARESILRYRDLMVDAPDGLTTSGGLTPIPHGPTFFVSICFCGARAEGDALLARWLDRLQPEKHNIEWGPYSSELSVPAAPSVGTGRFLPELSDSVIDVLADAFTNAPVPTSAVWNDFHGAVTRVPLDATAFPLRQRGFDLFLSIPWTTEAERDRAIEWSTELSTNLAPFSRGVYVNNLNETEADRVPEAYGPHYERLRAIKATYDPDNFFRVNHNIRPAGG
jgi:FAD/FMN-containing dehydrogenase